MFTRRNIPAAPGFRFRCCINALVAQSWVPNMLVESQIHAATDVNADPLATEVVLKHLRRWCMPDSSAPIFIVDGLYL